MVIRLAQLIVAPVCGLVLFAACSPDPPSAQIDRQAEAREAEIARVRNLSETNTTLVGRITALERLMSLNAATTDEQEQLRKLRKLHSDEIAKVKRASESAERAAKVAATEGDASSARYACKQLVARSLKDPNAEFPTWTQSFTEKRKGRIWFVQIEAHARNSFNALLRTTVNCTVRYEGAGKWIPISIKEI